MNFVAFAQEDCDCEIGPEDIPVCVEVEEGIVIPFPNECFAECFGFAEESYVECEDLNPWPQDSTYADCDCEILEEEEIICVLTDAETGVICPFPNLCFAECLGYSEEDVVDCGDFDWDYDTEWPQDSTWIDSTWVDPCDCDWDIDPELEWICVVDEDGFPIPYPSLCFAECDGFSEADLVDCDFDGNWNQDTTYVDCDCDWDIDPELEWICVADEDGFPIPYPSLCFAECDGFSEADLVDCDFDGDWGQDSTYVECECEILDEEDFICVLTDAETGEVCPFPNLCFAECYGYTEEDVIDCEEGDFNWDVLDCDCEISEDDVAVCVELEGVQFEIPNECFAECFELEIVDCEEEFGGSIEQGMKAIEQEEAISERINGNPNIVMDAVYPNPVATDDLDLVIDVDGIGINAELNLTDFNGNILTRMNLNLESGQNKVNITLQNINKGIFFVNIISREGVQTQRLIKL